MKKTLFLGLNLLLASFSVNAQNSFHVEGDNSFLKHLDVSFSLSTVGVGVDVASPINSSINVRTGFHFIPKIKPQMSFGVGLEGKANADGSIGPVTPGRFEEMQDLFSQLTGNHVDDRVDMIGEPTMTNFSLLVDVSPFKNKKWHFTAGVFAGPSRIAKAYNTTEDMPSLFSVNVYNKMYEAAYNEEPIYTMPNGTIVYLDADIEEKLLENGRMSINLGDRTDGSGAYRLEPDYESMVKVRVKVKPVRPYLGCGYSNSFKYKNKETRYGFSFNAGVMFWGGTPEIITHDGTDLAKDVTNIRGKVGDYVRFMKAFKVCPMLSFKLTKRIF